MKFVLRAAPVLAVLSVATSVHAADLARVYTKAPAVPMFNWTGFYLSGGAGYGMWTASQRSHAPSDPTTLSDRTGGRGYFGTVGGGFDWQLSSSWVAGVFADAQFGNMSGDATFVGLGLIGEMKNDLNVAAGARLGYLVAPNVLTYVNGGYSHARFSGTNYVDAQTGGNTPLSTPHFTRDGWFVGGGVENSLNIFGMSAPGWFMKSEYRFASYDTKDLPVSGLPSVGVFRRPDVQTVSTSLVYRFYADGVPAAASPPLYAKAPAAMSSNWTGLYLSGGGGYGMVSADNQLVAAGAPFGLSERTGGRGAFGTVGAGYDWQFSRSWVAGVLADVQFGDIKSFIGSPAESAGIGGTTKNNLNYAVGARLGYLVAPNVLSYVNAGYSHADFKAAAMPRLYDGEPWVNVGKSHFDGWFVGGGVESSLNIFGIAASGWFMKTEYRLAEYDRKNVDLFDGTGPISGVAIAGKPYVQTVSGSLVYRFNWGGPN